MKIQAHNSLEPPLEYKNELWVTKILCSFRLILEGKTGKEKFEWIFDFLNPFSNISGYLNLRDIFRFIFRQLRITFLEKFLANNFALSDAEDITSKPLNTGSIADLSLLRKLSPIHQKSWEPSFWEVMDSFVLLAYASLATSRNLLQQLLACLNFLLDSEDLFCWYKQKKVISMKYGSSTSS